MQLSFPTPPAAVADLLAQDHTAPGGARFAPLRNLPTPAARTFGLEAVAAPGVALQPHEEYTIPLKSLLGEAPLESAVLNGWRTLDVPTAPLGGAGAGAANAFRMAEAGGAPPVASRLVSYDAAQQQAQLEVFNVGPFGPATVQALASLQSADVPGNATVRFLLLPHIYVAALWLQEGDTSRFLPLAPCPPALEPGTLYSEDAFLEILRPLAKAALSFDSSPQL